MLITSLCPRRTRVQALVEATWPVCWPVFERSATRFWLGRENPIRSSSFRKPSSTSSHHRALVKEGIESHVVDAASSQFRSVVDAPRPTRSMAKAAARVLAFKRRAACVRWAVPMPETRIAAGFVAAPDADRRADTACQSDQRPAVFSEIDDNEPLRRDQRRALEAARTGDGVRWREHEAKSPSIGSILLLGQMAAIEAERDAMLARQVEAEAVRRQARQRACRSRWT